MVGIKRYWSTFRNFAIIFSFICNFVLIVVLLVVVTLLFQIKAGIADPLVNGLYSSFVGLNEAKIITNINVTDQINVKDTIPVKLDIPLKQNTVVALTQDVRLNANATFTLPGGGGNIRGSVAITLPVGLELPVALNLNVPVDSTLPIDLKVPINLNVPVNIDLKETQLNDVAQSLRSVVEPFARILNNLPNSWQDMWPLIGQIISGRGPDLLAPNDFTRNAWPGFRTGPGSSLPSLTPESRPALSPTPTFEQIGVPLVETVTPAPGQETPGSPGNSTELTPSPAAVPGETGGPEMTPTSTLFIPSLTATPEGGSAEVTPTATP